MARPMHPDALQQLATRIMERAKAEKIVQLSPATALAIARILTAATHQPPRWKVIKAICQLPRCRDQREGCVECTMKANGIAKLFEDEFRFKAGIRTSE